MGYSDDGFPFVGRVHGKESQFICAGFTGHGMPQIFLCAKAIAQMIITGSGENEVDLPLPYHADTKRWGQQREHMSLKMWRNVTTRMRKQTKL